MSQTNEGETINGQAVTIDERGNVIIDVGSPSEEEKEEARKALAPLIEYWKDGNEGPLPGPPNQDPEPPRYIETQVPDDGHFGARTGTGVGDLGGKIRKEPNPAWIEWARRNGKIDAPPAVLTENAAVEVPVQSTAAITGSSPFAVASQIEHLLPQGAQMKVEGRQIIISL